MLNKNKLSTSDLFLVNDAGTEDRPGAAIQMQIIKALRNQDKKMTAPQQEPALWRDPGEKADPAIPKLDLFLNQIMKGDNKEDDSGQFTPPSPLGF